MQKSDMLNEFYLDKCLGYLDGLTSNSEVSAEYTVYTLPNGVVRRFQISYLLDGNVVTCTPKMESSPDSWWAKYQIRKAASKFIREVEKNV